MKLEFPRPTMFFQVAAMHEMESIELLNLWRGGDQHAAEAMFERYVNRLVALARTRLSSRLGQRVSPEDVVQSVYRSFFENAREGQYVLKRSGDLWRLLAAITGNKVKQKWTEHTAQKRDMNAEIPLVADSDNYNGIPVGVLARDEPGIEDAAILEEELLATMEELSENQRRMLELRLGGAGVPEIADQANVSERTVRRTLDRIRNTLEERLATAEEEI